ncbi:trehalose-phosphatase, partial [Streptomyces sp. NTH33]
MGSQDSHATDSTTPVPSLPTPATRAGRDGLAALLARPERAVIALDFDGTLAPIVPDPDQARA